MVCPVTFRLCLRPRNPLVVHQCVRRGIRVAFHRVFHLENQVPIQAGSRRGNRVRFHLGSRVAIRRESLRYVQAASRRRNQVGSRRGNRVRFHLCFLQDSPLVSPAVSLVLWVRSCLSRSWNARLLVLKLRP